MCASRGLVAGLVRIAHIVIILELQQSQQHSARALRERRSRFSYVEHNKGSTSNVARRRQESINAGNLIHKSAYQNTGGKDYKYTNHCNLTRHVGA